VTQRNAETVASGKTWLKVSKDTVDTLPDSFAMRQRRLLWDPTGFVIENDRLENKIIEAEVQTKSLERWVKNPKMPVTYIVAGSTNDEKAKYFAAHLVDIHRQRLGVNAEVWWEPIYNGYENKLIQRETSPSLIVLTNLTTVSNYLKYDKARDVIERFPSVPKIIVVAGEDPISFAAVRLHVACHALAYFGSSLKKNYSEVV